MVSLSMSGMAQNQINAVSKQKASWWARIGNWLVFLVIALAFCAGFYFGRIDSAATANQENVDNHGSYGRFGHR